MIYYKSKDGQVYAYQTEQDRIKYGAPDLVAMTAEEFDAFINKPEPTPVPKQVTRAQGKAALLQADLLPAVQAYADAIEDPTQKALAQIALNDTTHWERSSPFLTAAAASLGLTEEQIDQLFIQAAQIAL